MFPGLLEGKEDLRQFYAALRNLCAFVASATRWSTDARDAIRPLASVHLLAERSRLDFIPAMPLPPTDQGRSAAYLYNRLSNNVEEPTLVVAGREREAIDSSASVFDGCSAVGSLHLRKVDGAAAGARGYGRESRTSTRRELNP